VGSGGQFVQTHRQLSHEQFDLAIYTASRSSNGGIHRQLDKFRPVRARAVAGAATSAHRAPLIQPCTASG
jgi:hypothetical protein